MSEQWTIVQACVWIATRDAEQVKSIKPNCTRMEAGYIVYPEDLPKQPERPTDDLKRGVEPPRVFRRLFGLSHAAIAGWSSVA
jgi:hypothetical protein